MKHKIFALMLALSVVSWAQTATQTPSTPQQSTAPAEKGNCPCCDKISSASTTSSMKDAHSCCAHHDMAKSEGKDAASCCAGKDAKCCGDKDAKSCMKDGKDAASCCGKSCGKDKTAANGCGDKCGKDCKKGCCSQKEEKTASNCCADKLHS